MNQAFSAKRHASKISGKSYSSHTSRTARTFSIDTGWPPPELLVTVNITIGMRSAPTSSIVALSASTSMFPLNGRITDGSRPSGMTMSRASAPWYSTLARVVSKWVLFGTTSPSLTATVNRIFSAALPWCVGMTWSNPVMLLTADSNRKKDLLPA